MNFKNILTFKNIIFLILVFIVLYFVSNIISVFMLFFAAFVLAASLEPIVLFLQKKMNRTSATAIVMVGTVVGLVAFIIPILRLAFEQIVAFMNALPARLDVLDDYLKTQNLYGTSNSIDLSAFMGTATEITKNIFDHSLSATVGFFNFLVFFIALVMIMFYIIKDKTYMTDKFVEFFPPELKDKAKEIVNTISDKVGGYVIAQIISNTAIWAMVTVVLFAFGVDYAVVLGLIAGVLDIVPVLGPTVALLLIVLASYHLGAVKVALIIMLFLVIQQISNSLVRPIVFGKFLDLHPLVILFAIFIAAQFFGLLGVILAPAIAATVCVLIDELYLIPINRSK